MTYSSVNEGLRAFCLEGEYKSASPSGFLWPGLSSGLCLLRPNSFTRFLCEESMKAGVFIGMYSGMQPRPPERRMVRVYLRPL